MTILIGSDESLKGDTFGGLTVAAVLTTPEEEAKLTALGVTDSKKFTDIKIPLFAARIREICPYHCVCSIFPKEYNDFSMTGLMNKYHRHCYEEVLQAFLVAHKLDTPVTHIVDKYPGATVGDILEIKAESKYVCVAAASILAREAALAQLRVLSERAGFVVPKGSTHVEDALIRLFASNLRVDEFVKLHFKNVRLHIERKHRGL